MSVLEDSGVERVSTLDATRESSTVLFEDSGYFVESVFLDKKIETQCFPQKWARSHVWRLLQVGSILGQGEPPLVTIIIILPGVAEGGGFMPPLQPFIAAIPLVVLLLVFNFIFSFLFNFIRNGVSVTVGRCKTQVSFLFCTDP